MKSEFSCDYSDWSSYDQRPASVFLHPDSSRGVRIPTQAPKNADKQESVGFSPFLLMLIAPMMNKCGGLKFFLFFPKCRIVLHTLKLVVFLWYSYIYLIYLEYNKVYWWHKQCQQLLKRQKSQDCFCLISNSWVSILLRCMTAYSHHIWFAARLAH